MNGPFVASGVYTALVPLTGRIRWLVVVPVIPTIHRHSREGGNPDEHREVLRRGGLAMNIALAGLLPLPAQGQALRRSDTN